MKMFRPLNCAFIACVGVSASAAPFVGDVTPDVIFGDGNANGNFVIDQGTGSASDVEVGLRAKIRYDVINDEPQNVFNRTGSNYVMSAGAPAAFPTRARWNFEFSINSDINDDPNAGPAAVNLLSYDFKLFLDSDPSAATTFVEINPILTGTPSGPFVLGVFGNNGTANGDGQDLSLTVNGSNNNVIQDSQNYGFGNLGIPGFNPNATGIYDIKLEAYEIGDTSPIASSSITVEVVPEPATLGLVGLGLAGLCGYRFRKTDENA